MKRGGYFSQAWCSGVAEKKFLPLEDFKLRITVTFHSALGAFVSPPKNRTLVGNEPWMCSKMCFTKTE